MEKMLLIIFFILSLGVFTHGEVKPRLLAQNHERQKTKIQTGKTKKSPVKVVKDTDTQVQSNKFSAPPSSNQLKGKTKESGEKGETFSGDQFKIVKVNGMVCSFCSSSIEKKFKNQKGVKSVKVDLGAKTVTLVVNPPESLSDKQIEKLITASGFQTVSIEEKKEMENKKKDSKKKSEDDR